MSDNQYDGIAIVGMAGRFPGADSVEQFWANLLAGRESVSFFSDEELAESGLDAAELRRHGHYVAARGLLKDVDCFDAAFFGIHPREAEVMDPQQRVFLETCWAALERAGYPPNQMPGTVGVFAGSSFNTFYLHALHEKPELIELVGSDQVMFGNEKDYVATRVAYKLGLKGPALNVATACSTSLVAVCQACQCLLTYHCDMALAGAVSITVPQKRGYYHDDGQIGSGDGHTRAFDAQAAGTVFGNGVAVVVLKRLEEAVRDGDQIYAVIKGAAINNDGSQRVSFGAPGVEGQSQVIAMAHALAEVDPATITCVEAHGTATPLGDPIEVAGLTKAFRLATEATQFCALGSVKTNVGHLDVAAGVAGLIKMSLALHHKTIPASLHFTRPNPKLELEASPFYVNATRQDWKTAAGVPRRAGVSSFGTGGTNAHVVLEEAPALPASGPSRPCQLLILSAKTPDALERATASLSGHLKETALDLDSGDALRELADAAFTLQTGRSEFVHRRVVVCEEASEGGAALERRDPKRVFTHHQQLVDPPVIFMFPGQGAQYAGMGAELYRHEPVFRAEVDRCADWLRPLLDIDLRTVVFPASGSEQEAEELLIQTRLTQPALFVIEYALAKLWMSWGVQPAAMIGHSVGEYVAGCLAGVLTLEDALSLVARRGALVQAQPGGAMLSIRLAANEVSPLLDGRLAIAAINSPNLCVVSGPHDAIVELETQLAAQGVVARHLHTSHAFHSPMMDPVLSPFTELVRQVTLAEPRIPYVSNVTGRWITAAEATSADYWAGHVRQTVRFADGVALVLKGAGQVLLEVGPGQALCSLARQHPAKPADQTVLASLPLPGAQESRGMLETLGRLWMTGVKVDWPAFHAHERRHRKVLPTYPFERTRHWPDSLPASGTRPATAPAAAAAASASPAFLDVRQEPRAPAPPSPHVHPGTEVPRKQRLLTATRALLQDLSGYDLSGVDGSADLLELGLDSLLLTQAAQLFHRRFGISITFRQLMEELSSIEAIASFLDAKLPLEAFAAAVSGPTVAPEGPASPAALGGPQQAALELLLQQQQLLTNQLLQLLGRPDALVAAPPAASVPVWPALPTPAMTDVKAHGPFKPLDRSASTTLSPIQRRALDEVIAGYTRRTAGSKTLAAERRSVLADPRSVAGFNKLWKEMVYPISTNRSDGSKIWDVDRNEYVDFVMGFSASLFGHRPPFVVEAVRAQLDQGFEIGPIQPVAGEVAALVSELTGQPRVGFTNTGSEAVLAAMRVARTVTGRDKIAVFAGAYHGIFDEVLFRPLTVNGEARAAAIAPGIPESALSQMIVLEYCNPESLEILRARGSEIAAVLVEPIQARRLDLQPRDFLHELRRITEQTGTALIIDEIVTGFRLHPAGAQGYFGVRADLATYGKVMGGGMPIGVVAGAARFMDALDGGQWQYGDASFPEVGVTFFAGTFVRHPVALAAAKAVLTHLKQCGPELQRGLAERTERVANQLRAIIDEYQAPYAVRQFSSLMQLTFPPEQKLAGLLFYLMRERGIHIWENRGVVMTTAHSDEDAVKLAGALRESLAVMRDGEFLMPFSAHARPSRGVGATTEAVSTDTVPLTEAQLEVWLGSQMGTAASCSFNEVVALDLHGPMDPSAMERALAQVVARHESLRMTVVSEPLGLRVAAHMEVPLVLRHLEELPAESRETALHQVFRAGDAEAFDLARGPLLRLTLVRLATEHHVLVMVAHHLACDGWSFGIVIRDLAALYSAAVQGQRAELPVPLQVSRFARDAHENRQSQEAAETEAFWIRQFQTIPDPLELPADRPRPAVKSYRAARLAVQFDSALASRVKRLASQHRATLFTTLLGAFETLVYRLTGQDDFVVGIPIAGQSRLGGQDLVAHCVNFVPFRATPRGTATFSEYLGAVRTRALDVSEHQNFTYGSLLEKLRLPHDPGRDPLVSISFTLEPALTDLAFHRLTATRLTLPRTTSKRDLHVQVMETDTGFLVEADYCTDLFDEATVRRWLESFRVLLEAVVAAPDRRLSDLPMIPDEDARRLLVEWNDTVALYPSDRLIHQLVEHWAERTPDAPAVACDGTRLTWAELNRRANQVARILMKKGVTRGSAVALCLERSEDFIVGLLAAHKAGAAYVPLDPAYPQERLAFLLQDAGVRVVVTHATFAHRLPAAGVAVLPIDSLAGEIARESGADLGVAVSPEDIAYVIYTSGSTGQPKGVAVEHRQLLNYTWAVIERMSLPAGSSFALASTVAADLGNTAIYPALATGGLLHVLTAATASDGRAFGAYFAEHAVDVLKITPSHLASLLGEYQSPALLPRHCLVLGGEASRPTWVAELRRLAPACTIINHYGPTETTVGALTYRITGDPDDLPGDSVPIGRPLGNVRAYVLDACGMPAPIGVPGELFIGGAGVARGYLNRPDLTAERFVPDTFLDEPGARMYRTGDRARFLPDGNIEFLGRLDHQVKVRGFRVELGEIEAALRAHPTVDGAVVLLREDTPGDQRLVAYVTAAAPATVLAGDVRAYLKQTLPDYLVPSAIVPLDAWPLTPNGKIDRRALPAPSDGRLSLPSAFVAPATPTEQRVAAIWSEILGVSVTAIGAHDDFFDLGGHSLLAARAAMRVRDQFQVEVSLATFFEAPTVAALAERIDTAGAATGPRSITRAPRERARRDQLTRT